jgi:hypothetical protein
MTVCSRRIEKDPEIGALAFYLRYDGLTPQCFITVTASLHTETHTPMGMK